MYDFPPRVPDEFNTLESIDSHIPLKRPIFLNFSLDCLSKPKLLNLNSISGTISPDPGREPLNESPKFISIFCEKDEVDDFISRGFLLVYSINAHLVPAPEYRNDTLSREPGEKRYYKMIKKVN